MDFLVCFLFVLAAALSIRLYGLYDVGTSYFLIWIFMALGLCLMWGYGGMLSFGQTLFFGISGYAWRAGINMVGRRRSPRSPVDHHCDDRGRYPRLLHDLGRHQRSFRYRDPVGDAVLAFFLGQTAGPEWHIGPARLNGYNGMKGMDPLAIGDFYIEGSALYYFMVALIVIVYLALRMLVNSRIGNVIVATRENPQRAEMLGYDVRKYQLLTFIIGSGLAGSAARFTSGSNSSPHRASGCRRLPCRSRVGRILRAQ
jgi:branched-chain amino acid transport system permease protein